MIRPAEDDSESSAWWWEDKGSRYSRVDTDLARAKTFANGYTPMWIWLAGVNPHTPSHACLNTERQQHAVIRYRSRKCPPSAQSCIAAVTKMQDPHEGRPRGGCRLHSSLIVLQNFCRMPKQFRPDRWLMYSLIRGWVCESSGQRRRGDLVHSLLARVHLNKHQALVVHSVVMIQSCS
jgi:hypothetical protein